MTVRKNAVVMDIPPLAVLAEDGAFIPDIPPDRGLIIEWNNRKRRRERRSMGGTAHHKRHVPAVSAVG